MTERDYFGDLGVTGAHFQGGFITLRGHGCRKCGNGFWTEGDEKRRLTPGTEHPCPHCGETSIVREGDWIAERSSVPPRVITEEGAR